MIAVALLAAAARFFASTTAVAHRVALPSSAAQVAVSTFEATIEVRDAQGQLVRGGGEAFNGTICRAAGSELRLSCSHGRIEASLVRLGKKTFLDLRELRGLPDGDGDEAIPAPAYAPQAFALGDACPGNTPASRGECALQARNFELAQQELAWLGATGESADDAPAAGGQSVNETARNSLQFNA